MREHVLLMDTTLRDGEQTQGVSFAPDEKVSIARALLHSLKVDRIEVASAGVSHGEKEAVTRIHDWAARAIMRRASPRAQGAGRCAATRVTTTTSS